VIRVYPEQIKKDYPIHGLVDGWYFRVNEVSPYMWVVAGADESGRTVEFKGAGSNEDDLLQEAVEYAKSLGKVEFSPPKKDFDGKYN